MPATWRRRVILWAWRRWCLQPAYRNERAFVCTPVDQREREVATIREAARFLHGLYRPPGQAAAVSVFTRCDAVEASLWALLGEQPPQPVDPHAPPYLERSKI